MRGNILGVIFEMDDIKSFLRKNNIFFSRLGFCYDPPILNEKGKPLVFSEDFDKYLNYHRDMYNAGIKIHTCIVHSGWIGVDKYDYSVADRSFESIFSIADDIMFIPRVKLNVPIDWCKENPRDVCVYYGGPRTEEKIKELVGTLRQDYLGYDSKNGYYQAGEFDDPRPNVEGLISLQSLSSEKWLKDATRTLEKFIEHFESMEYADRIICYQVSFGPCGENMHWGRQSHRYGDYGIQNLRNFYKYGIEKYGAVDILKKVWGEQHVKDDTIDLPSPGERYDTDGSAIDFFRGNSIERISEDYDYFLSDVIANAINCFGGVVKKMTNKGTGFFYGYFMYMWNSAYGGHLALDKVLASDNVDFLAAPMAYYRRVAGEPSADMCPAQSVNLSKVWIEEVDCRTNLSRTKLDLLENMFANTFEESFYVFWRNICKNLQNGSGLWWMDLGGGWFNAPEIWAEIAKTNAFAERVNAKKGKSLSDVLIVVDEKCMYKMKESQELCFAFMLDIVCETHCSGVLADTYRLSDLKKIDISQYKLIIFAYDFNLSKEFLDELNIADDVTVMFCYAAGINADGKFNIDNIKKLTGFCVEETFKHSDFSFPMFKTKGGKDIEYSENDGKKYIMDLRPYITATELREIARKAGCRVYTDFDCILYGDSRFLGVFRKEKTKGRLNLFNKRKIENVLTGERFSENYVDLDFENDNRAIFYFEDV